MHVNDKKHIVDLFSPNTDFYGNISLQVHSALSNITAIKKIKIISTQITDATYLIAKSHKKIAVDIPGGKSNSRKVGLYNK